MTRPRRLIEHNELFASLVDDARRREPSAEALERLLAVLDSPAAAASAPPRARLRMPTPWLCLALAGAGALALLGYAMDRPRGALGPVVAAAPSIDVPAGPVVAAAPSIEAPLDVPAASPPPEAVPSRAIAELPDAKEPAQGRSSSGRAPTSQGPSAAQGASAAQAAKPAPVRELELITRAREALTKGDIRTCLATIARHDTEFPNGQFVPEAAVMRIEATLASGDRTGARSLARSFLAKSPESPYAARLRSLLGSLEQE